jgi:hypothetical protein
MKMTPLARTLLAATSIVLGLGLAACGSSNKNNGNPDAGSNQGSDSGPPIDGPVDGTVAPTCVTTTYGAQAIVDNTPGTDIVWGGDATPDQSGGGTTQYTMEFYPNLDASAPIDLSMGDFAQYATCLACFRVIAVAADGMTLAHMFFQDGGTLTLTADPNATSTLAGTITNLSLVEVTIDAQNNSTLVPGGICLAVGNVTLAADLVPADWTCDHAKFGDGTTCDCGCGDHDPDCDNTAAPVAGCPGTQTCLSDVCTDSCNVQSPPAPVGCSATAGVCGINLQNATTDACYADATLVDPAAVGTACASTTLLCSVTGTDSRGLCDNFIGADSICRKECDANSDCVTATEVCSPLFATGTQGLCTPKPPANDKCSTAQAVTIGTQINGTSLFATSNYNAGLDTCTGFPQPGPDVAYKVTLAAAQAITITVTPTDLTSIFDPSVSILGPGTAAAVCGDPADTTAVTCLAGADNGASAAPETLAFTATTAGTYFIIVDSFENPGGAFTLLVTSP